MTTQAGAPNMTCRDCQLHRNLPLEPIVARLEARGIGGALLPSAHLPDLYWRPAAAAAAPGSCPRPRSPRATSTPRNIGRLFQFDGSD